MLGSAVKLFIRHSLSFVFVPKILYVALIAVQLFICMSETATA